MSLILELKHTGDIVKLFRWLLRPVYYAFQGEDLFHVLPGSHGSIAVLLQDDGLAADVARREREQMFQHRVLDAKEWEKRRPQKQGKLFNLTQILRSVCTYRKSGIAPGNELLLVGWRTKDEMLPRLFDKVPRHHERPARVLFLAENPQGGNQTRPQFMVTVPEPDVQKDWGAWVAELRRESEGTDLKLFRKLQGAQTAEFYVEIGHEYPFEAEVAQIYPNPDDARVILIHGSRAEAGTAAAPAGDRARWTELRPADLGTQVLLEGTGAPGKIELDDDGDRELVVVGDGARRDLHWQLQLRSVPDNRRERLLVVEGRIQSARDDLLRLEDERLRLLERRRDRFRFVLCFRQPQSNDDGPMRLAPEFERFLHLARRQLHKLTYRYAEGDQHRVEGGRDGNGIGAAIAGLHLVCTTEPMLYQDLPVALADEVYYQPHYWQDLWQLNVFVLDTFDLAPRIDQKSLAEMVKGALGTALADGRCVLLAPGTEGKVRVTPLALPAGGGVAEMLRFLNTQFQAASLRLLSDARANLKKELEDQKRDLIIDIDASEKRLCEDADRRLQVAQRRWNELVPQIEGVLALELGASGKLDIVEDLLRAAATSWREVMEAMIRTHEALVAAKITALQDLDLWTPTWEQRVKATERANADTAKLLEELRGSLDPLLADAQREQAEAEAEDVRTRAQYEATKREIDAFNARIDQLVKDAGDSLAECTGKKKVLDADVQKAQELLDSISAVLKDLQAQATEFARLLDRIGQGRRVIARQLDRLTEQQKKAEDELLHWRSEADAAEAGATEVEARAERANLEVLGLRERIAVAKAGAERWQKQLREMRDEVEKEIVSTRHELSTCHDTTRALRAARVQMQSLTAQVASARTLHDKERAALTQSASQLEELLGTEDQECRARIGRITEHLRQFAADLDRLATLEHNFAAYGRAPLQARALAGLVTGANLSALDNRQHRLIWGGEDPPVSTGNSGGGA